MTKAGVKPGTEDWKYGLVNGHLREPAASTNIHIPSAELQKYEDRKAAAVRENNGKPLSESQLADLSKDGATGLPINQWQGLISKRDAAYAKAQSDHQAAYKNAVGTKEKDRENSRYQGQLDSLQSEWNNRLSEADPEGRYAQGPGSGNPAPPAAPSALTAPTPAPSAPPGTQPHMAQQNTGPTPNRAVTTGIPTSAIQVTDPNGGVHTFPNQAAADKFKKLAGIK